MNTFGQDHAQPLTVWSPKSVLTRDVSAIIDGLRARNVPVDLTQSRMSKLWILDGGMQDDPRVVDEYRALATKPSVIYLASRYTTAPVPQWSHFFTPVDLQKLESWLISHQIHPHLIGSADPSQTTESSVGFVPFEAPEPEQAWETPRAATQEETPRALTEREPLLAGQQFTPTKSNDAVPEFIPLDVWAPEPSTAQKRPFNETPVVVTPKAVPTQQASSPSLSSEPSKSSAELKPISVEPRWRTHSFRLRRWPDITRYSDEPGVVTMCGTALHSWVRREDLVRRGVSEDVVDAILTDAETDKILVYAESQNDVAATTGRSSMESGKGGSSSFFRRILGKFSSWK